jgi:hypothetical protein
MKLRPWLVLFGLLCTPHLWAETSCEGEPADLLVLGDSQTGATWATAYFGNFLQKCLTEGGKKFVSYARGGTQPIHWLNHPGLDRIETIFRSPDHPHLNLGSDVLPTCKKRLDSLIRIHQPKEVLLFFGDNLLSSPTAEVRKQFRGLVETLVRMGIDENHCTLLTPSFEMEVASKRNVPSKNLENTQKVIAAILEEAQGKCRILNGLEIMEQTVFRSGDLLRRIPVEGTSGCFGKAANDNIHYCGAAAQELAQQVCKQLMAY